MIKFMARAFFAPVARLVFRPRIIGKNNVPTTGAVLLASNHLSFIDSVVVTLVAPRSISFLAKSEYFTGTGVKGWMSRAFFTGIGAIPVERGAGHAAQEALDSGLKVLQDGGAFAIYPEGTRSRDGRLYRGRTGVAWLALTAGSVVIPVALTGTENLQPPGAKWVKLARVTVEFGAPMDLSAHGPATSGRARRTATDDVMEAIQRMSGQEFAHEYNEPPPVTVAERVRRVFRRRGRH
ncbi:1-acyl-sn-glycerol-3-phosphate acyltransferase [Salinibacterium sp. CAN_S4]|uniref:lysophospholipid acyltransferase family protein n=1 Tax=Salinibacterium sp. CAN_S4 TaxID=2787727 RepID=UPI0018EFC012